ncbi:penicillin acylase family protein [Wenyingzhuangia sp. 2_MG-2023]|uniref:penicillin acylase family protein n=1 Tax=Wenyingzhuangia sp. 2_MG-2023 TaxID=3062639 RepID=UPI0026E22C01|nr:penicillin acylase family protein [Wenyingzhuangia sp. 2_MG-2023]MDO6738143.1 penicillin acylase family protein [Wenyingzhuangia sp. 2_MG-2023]
MKWFKRIAFTLLSLLVLITLAIYLYFEHLKPTYQGTIHVQGIQNTEVYFDSIGVPHIFSESETDAMKALGYVHAQERLWQMELLRRIASSRLSEILGKDLIAVDEFFAHLGIDETVDKQVLALDKNPKVKKLTEAYLQGINTFVKEGTTPIEFTLLGIEKEEYQIKDIYYVTAYMAFSFAHAFKTDPLLSHIKNKLGTAYLNDLAIEADEHTFYQENYREEVQAITQIAKVLKKLPFPQFIGSNGYVLGPEKTTTGNVLFENDPHIGFSQPCVWYQAHIKTPNYENYGFYLGLMPFPLLAHNRDFAFGITMFENDDINFHSFKNHPSDSSKYITSSGVHSYQYITKYIHIKGEESKKISVKKTILGTVFNQQQKTLDSMQPIAVQWVYNEKPSTVVQTSYGLNHAKNIISFEKELKGLTAPGLNYVYGDAQNNIALWSVAQLYKFQNKINTKYVLNGMDSTQVKKEWLSFDKNPKAINPSKGYVLTSNTQPEAVNGELYQGYYLPRDRATAIKTGIEAKDKLSVNDVQSLTNSHTNKTAVSNVVALLKGVDLEKLSPYELTVLEKLIQWKGNHGLENVGPTIYYKFTSRLIKHTFLDELEPLFFDDFVLTNLSKRTLNKYVHLPNSIWWDDVTTPQKETFKDIVMKSFQESVGELKTQLGENVEDWQWKKVHQVTHEHALAKMDLLRKLFNVGSLEAVGGNETVNNLMFDYTDTGVYKVNAGPSTRRIVDFSDIENSYAILPTGQSGNFMSPYYKNQTEDYLKGTYHKMLINETEIKKSENRVRFQD